MKFQDQVVDFKALRRPPERLYGKFWTLTGFSGILTQVGDSQLEVIIHGRSFNHRLTLPYHKLDQGLVHLDLAELLRWKGFIPDRENVPF